MAKKPTEAQLKAEQEQIERELSGEFYDPSGKPLRKSSVKKEGKSKREKKAPKSTTGVVKVLSEVITSPKPKKAQAKPTKKTRKGKKRPPRKPEVQKQVGLFIKEYLESFGETYISDLHAKYKDFYRQEYSSRGTRYKLSGYHSFCTMISKLINIGLLERTGRIEESTNPKAANLGAITVVYVDLSPKGRTAPDQVWKSPFRLYYYPTEMERQEFPDFVKPD